MKILVIRIPVARLIAVTLFLLGLCALAASVL